MRLIKSLLVFTLFTLAAALVVSATTTMASEGSMAAERKPTCAAYGRVSQESTPLASRDGGTLAWGAGFGGAVAWHRCSVSSSRLGTGLVCGLFPSRDVATTPWRRSLPTGARC